MSDAERITELELELMAQRDLIDALNAELTAANDRGGVLAQRVDRLETQVEALMQVVDRPIVEKPPHY